MIKAEKPENTFTFELCPEGNHTATLFKIINFGTLETEWKGKKKEQKKIRLYWEIPEEKYTYEDKDGKEIQTHHTISSEYTLSFSDQAKLRPIVTGMMGSMNEEELWDFDIEQLLGRACLLNVVHEKGKNDPSKVYSVVGATSPLIKGLTAPEPLMAQSVIDVNTASEEEIESLSGNLKDKMKSSKEYKLKDKVEQNEITMDDM